MLKQVVFLTADMTAQQIAEAFQQFSRWRVAHLANHTFKRTMVGDQFREDRHFAQFSLDQGKQKLLLDGEMIDQLDFVAVDSFGREPPDRDCGVVGTQGALSQNAQREAVVVLLGKWNKRGIAEHAFILRQFGTGARESLYFISMPFCVKCGAQLGGQANFCASCGNAAAGSAVPAPVVEPLEYAIQGDNLQVARVYLKPGQEVYAEAGKMVYKTANVAWETRMSGESLGEKLMGALRRTITGESLFLTYFRSDGAGEVGFAGSYPGKIQLFDLAAGESIMAQRDAFLFAQTSVQFNVAFVKRLGAGFFGGEGFILEKLIGPGAVFIHAGGDFVEFQLNEGEVMHVDAGNIVAFDESVDYDIEFVGGIKSAIFGGEGLFLARMTGPGRLIVQSMTINKLRRELAPGKTSADEHSPLSAITDVFTSED